MLLPIVGSPKAFSMEMRHLKGKQCIHGVPEILFLPFMLLLLLFLSGLEAILRAFLETMPIFSFRIFLMTVKPWWYQKKGIHRNHAILYHFQCLSMKITSLLLVVTDIRNQAFWVCKIFLLSLTKNTGFACLLQSLFLNCF